MKKVLQPPDARTLKYTVDIPLKRPEILPKEILQLASPVNFDKISDSKSFEIEKDLLKGINSHFNLKQVLHIIETEFINESCNDQCLLLDCLPDPATNFETKYIPTLKKNHENSDSYFRKWLLDLGARYLKQNWVFGIKCECSLLEKKDMPNDLLLANTDVIKYSMEHIFNQSRNTNVDSYVRDVVASYIYEKFVRYGLVAAIHSFSHARPKYEEQDEVSTSFFIQTSREFKVHFFITLLTNISWVLRFPPYDTKLASV